MLLSRGALSKPVPPFSWGQEHRNLLGLLSEGKKNTSDVQGLGLFVSYTSIFLYNKF